MVNITIYSSWLAISEIGQPGGNGREHNTKEYAQGLDGQEHQGRFEDGAHGNFRRAHAANIEQRIAEGRAQERHLHVHQIQHPEPQHHVLAGDAPQAEQTRESQSFHNGDKDSYRQQQNADPVQEHAQHHQQDHQQEQDAVGRQAGAQNRFGDKVLTTLKNVEAHKHQGTEHDLEHHGGGLVGGDRGVPQGGDSEHLVFHGHQNGAERTDTGGINRRSNAPEEQAKHQEHQNKRGNQVFQKQELVLQADAFLLGNGRPEFGVQLRPNPDIEHIQAGQQKARNHRAQIQFTHRLLGHHGIEDRQNRRRNENPQSTARHDGAEGDLVVVTPFEHGRQSNDPHGHDRRTDTPDHGRKNSGGDNSGNGQTTANTAHPFIDDVEHLLDQPGPFQHRRHEDEQRDSGQIRVCHHREDAAGDDVQHQRIPHQINEGNPQTTGNKRQWQAHHQGHQQGAEHQVGERPDFHIGQASGQLEQEFFITERVVKQYEIGRAHV